MRSALQAQVTLSDASHVCRVERYARKQRPYRVVYTDGTALDHLMLFEAMTEVAYHEYLPSKHEYASLLALDGAVNA